MPILIALLTGLFGFSATFAELIEKPRYYLGVEGTFTKGVVVFRLDAEKLTVLAVAAYEKDEREGIKLAKPTGENGALGPEQMIPAKLTCRIAEPVCGMPKEARPDVGDLVTVEARVTHLIIEEKAKEKRDIVLLEARSVKEEGTVPLEAQNFWTLADAIARSAGGSNFWPYLGVLTPFLLYEAVPVTP